MNKVTTTDILPDLENKGFHKIAHKIKKSITLDQLDLELWWTDYLQKLVDYGNNYLLKSFRLRLVMDEVY